MKNASIDLEEASNLQWIRDRPLRLALVALIFWLAVLALALQVFSNYLFPPAHKFIKLPAGADKKGVNVYTHHDAIPGSVFIRFPSSFDSFEPSEFHVNSFGIRGPEIKTKQAPRTLLLGDSFIEATAVQFENTVGELLNRDYHGRREFLAHGIGGWSPTTEFSWIYHKGLKLDLDEVILFTFVNDYFRSTADYMTDQSYRREAVWENGVPVRYNISTTPSFKQRMIAFLKEITIVNLTYYGVMAARTWFSKSDGAKNPLTSELVHFSQASTEWPQDLRDNVDAVVGVTKDMANFLSKKKVALKIIMLPAGFAWSDENVAGKMAYGYGWTKDYSLSQRGLDQHLEEKFAAAGIPFFNAFEFFDEAKRRDPGTLIYNEADGHLNARGHFILKQFIQQKVASQK